MTLGSWTYNTLRLDVQLEAPNADTSKFVNNGEWDLISIKGYRNEIKYPCCPKIPYADLTYTIRIRRRTRFYYINLIIPCFVITGAEIHLSLGLHSILPPPGQIFQLGPPNVKVLAFKLFVQRQ